jgi:hypothetical protein
VVAVLHRATLVVVGPTFHGQQRRSLGLAQRPGLGGGGRARPDRLLGQPRVDPADPQQLVQAARLQVRGPQPQQARRDMIAHERERLGLGRSQPLEHVHLGPHRDAEFGRQRVVGRADREAEHLRARRPPGLGQVVVQAGQLDLAAHLGVDDLGAHAALADQQPAVDQVLDGPAHGRPGQAELVGQVDLVVQPRPRGQVTGLDELLEVLGDLEVEGDRAVTVHQEGGAAHDNFLRDDHI